jgi:pimeloyl-ACP methyl ester carboxylesterase
VARVQIFLSTVSAEFQSYRDALRGDLDRPNVTVKVQEDFIATGTETLDKLDAYIRECNAVIHLVGDMTGALAQPPSVAVIRQRYPNFDIRLPVLSPFLQPGAPALSYTQWEAWLALYHGKVLIIAVPEQGAKRDERYHFDEKQRAAQQAHLTRLASVERYPEFRFANADRLAVEVLRSGLQDILASAGMLKKPANLPYRSIREIFKGREQALDVLAKTFGRIANTSASPAVAQVLHGLGGVGKTRLALEYAWQHADEYAALLFVSADSPEALQRNLAALCVPAILDLPEQRETDEAKQRDAVLGWLQQRPGWLLVLDGIDSEPAAWAAEALLPQLFGGHVLLTSRLTNWGGDLEAQSLGVLSLEAAVDFLLARTQDRRRQHSDDPAVAGALAQALGYLALALEQAGAYIARHRISIAQYLAQWQKQRKKVLAWFDARLMQYHSSVAVTWQTSFEQLGPAATHLLQRLAWLAPEPIPESLLEVPVPGHTSEETDALSALSELESYSLVSRAAATPSFSIHRLVQEVTRSPQSAALRNELITGALQWIDTAFVGDPSDVHNWPVLDPLAPHAQAVIEHAATVGIAEINSRLSNQLGVLLFNKAMYAEAELLMRRALAVFIDSLGPEHPNSYTVAENYVSLLQAMGKTEDEINDTLVAVLRGA